MEKELETIKQLRNLLIKQNQQVSELEMTSGNYDENKHLIKESVPTLTTTLCEIGTYDNKTCYFTIILYSDTFSEDIFNSIKDFKGVHLYGFKNFLEDYYPKKNFFINELKEQIKKEAYYQIQFNSDIKTLKVDGLLEKYLGIKDIFKRIKVINQLTHKF